MTKIPSWCQVGGKNKPEATKYSQIFTPILIINLIEKEDVAISPVRDGTHSPKPVDTTYTKSPPLAAPSTSFPTVATTTSPQLGSQPQPPLVCSTSGAFQETSLNYTCTSSVNWPQELCFPKHSWTLFPREQKSFVGTDSTQAVPSWPSSQHPETQYVGKVQAEIGIHGVPLLWHVKETCL